MHNEEGYTLIELSVVVAIVAVLVAMAIPAFSGARTRAQARRAQTGARTAVVTARTIQSAHGSYAAVGPADLKAAEPSYTFVAGATSSDDPNIVSVEVPDPDTLVVAVFSPSGECMWIRDTSDAAAAAAPYATTQSDGTDCAASAPPADSAFRSSWS